MRKLLRCLSAANRLQGRSYKRVYGPKEQDTLTGTANRNAFMRIVEEALAGRRESGCLVLVDIDHWHKLRDQYGKETGERILQTVAAALCEHFRDGDAIGRLEEDLFGLWIEGISAEHVKGIRRRIAMVNDRLLHEEGDLPRVTLSAGAALGDPGESCQDLYLQAGKVLHRVKEGGRCGCEIVMEERKPDEKSHGCADF